MKRLIAVIWPPLEPDAEPMSWPATIVLATVMFTLLCATGALLIASSH